MLEILFQDEHYVGVNKPSGLLVHRTRFQRHAPALLQELRDQLGRHVWPVHRLDRATSGLMVYGLNSESARRLAEVFREHAVEKRYLAVLRGWTDDTGVIDYPLSEAKDRERCRAVTAYRTLRRTEFPIPVGRYDTARYSLVEGLPETGRYHQLRKHFHHIFHPVVGDTQYGDGAHNRVVREHFDIHRLMLKATDLAFVHPFTGEKVALHAPPDEEFCRMFPEGDSVTGGQVSAPDSGTPPV